MKNALARNRLVDELPPDAGLRAALEEIRSLAAQSKLLALNTACEAAAARNEDTTRRDVQILAGEADRAASEADRVTSAVEILLKQIRAATAWH
jgi:predicted lipid-binding transport protein (Tim44 family)